MIGQAWQRDLQDEQRLATTALRHALRSSRGIPVRLRQAMAHSLLGGGKRLRPILVHWTWDALDTGGRGRRDAVDRATVQRVGAAVEMIHTYSLIHDDLPAMDDDVLRRGRPTCHVAFDEATAILAGDALQALAFEILAGAGPRSAELVAVVAAAAGPAGMVGGQMLDLQAETQAVSVSTVTRIHAAKTAAMIGMCLAAGGICRGAESTQISRLVAAGRRLGLAFQGADDLLDLSASSQELGKTPGKDSASGKATWVRLEGTAAAQARTRRLGRQGERELQALLAPGPEADRLLALAGYMWQRNC